MSDVDTLDGMIPEAKDPSSSKDEDNEDENLLTDMYQEPEHLLNDEHVILGSGDYLVAGNSPILPQFLTSVQDNQADGSPTPASPPAILDHPILQTLPTTPTVDPTMDGQFTVDAPMTRVGRKWKARDLQSILVVCTCGQAVSESEISQNANVIKCKRAGCETGWVSQMILSEDAKVIQYHLQCVQLEYSINGWMCEACEASGSGQRRAGKKRREQ
jgi:hypothetical protein